MRYWIALAYFRDTLITDTWKTVSLDDITQALNCTRRNAQLVIKRLAEEGSIGWKPGVGRGNLPQAILLKSVNERVERYAKRLMKEGKSEQAIALIPVCERDQFIVEFVAQYQTGVGEEHILQVPFYRGTHSLDVIGISRRSEAHIANHLYAHLVFWDHNAQEYKGDLAHYWEKTDHGTLFYLRKGLRFHDGSPILASDIRRHFERLMSSPHSTKAIYQFIDQVTVYDDWRIEFSSKALPNLIPKLLSSCVMGIAKKDKGRVIGSGPFMLQEQTEWRTLLKVFPYYHGHRPWIDGVEIWNVGDKAKDFELNSDVVHGVHLQNRSRDGFEEKKQWEKGCIYAQLNPNRLAWMKKQSHRKWLQHVIRSIPLPDVTWGEEVAYAEGMMKTPVFENMNSGSSPPTPETLPSVPLQILTYQLSIHIAAAQQIHDALSSLGVECELKILEFPEFDFVETLAKADIIVSGDVFEEDAELSWMSWFFSTNTNTACLTPKYMDWVKDKVVRAMQLPSKLQRLKQLEQTEQALVAKGLYQPIFHIRQDMSVSDKLTMTKLLPNGWIDFTQVVIKSSG